MIWGTTIFGNTHVKTPSKCSKKLSNVMQHDCISTYMIAMSGDIATPKVVRSKMMSSFNRNLITSLIFSVR